MAVFAAVALSVSGCGSPDDNPSNSGLNATAGSDCQNVGDQAESEGYLLECTETENGLFWIAMGSTGQSNNGGDGGDAGEGFKLGSRHATNVVDCGVKIAVLKFIALPLLDFGG